ncbi:MAG TPA: ATP-binding protein [Thermoanaerobaculia bacterium]|nr:ATP-binding protein [Thermoanaerobaculia bacterium]
MPKEVSLSIPSTPGMELAATAQAEALGEAMRLSRDKIDEVKFALVEACINAFEHGGQSAGQVDVRFRVSRRPGGAEMLEVSVADRGKGFDPERVEPPELDRKLRGGSKRGWGLKFIQSLMDEVEIRSTENGTTIVMRKYK